MSQNYVPGPCLLYTGTGSAGAYEFVGFSESGVNLNLASSWDEIYSDMSGPSIPLDVQWMGEQAMKSLVLNRYNEAILQKLVARRRTTANATVVPGACESNGLGSLMVAEGFAYPLALVFPYATKPFQSGTIVPGYTFGASWMTDNFEANLSVRVKRPQVVFRSIPTWNASVLSNLLYTNIVPGSLPSPN